MYSNECSAGLGFDRFSVYSPCHMLISGYSETFYITNVMSRPFNIMKGSNWTREVDRPSLIYIDLYIPTLTPGHH